MRIKINDKIYRLKEVESGVDSLMELVEEPKYKDGDFVYENNRIMIVNSYPNNYHANVWYIYSDRPEYNGTYAVDFSAPTFRYATEEEKQFLIDAMKKDGKRWNADKLEIEDITKRKFKAGDKVRIKDGISNKTHSDAKPCFTGIMDEFIGRVLTVKEHVHGGLYVKINEAKDGFLFHEDWLEPWSDEPKVGDWVIAWDVDRETANVGILEALGGEGEVFKYVVNGFKWMIAVKWDGTKEHLEKIRKG